jgi:hypothetical protein
MPERHTLAAYFLIIIPRFTFCQFPPTQFETACKSLVNGADASGSRIFSLSHTSAGGVNQEPKHF